MEPQSFSRSLGASFARRRLPISARIVAPILETSDTRSCLRPAGASGQDRLENLFQRLWRYPEDFKSRHGRGRDRINPHEIHLISREQWGRQQLRDTRHHVPDCERHGKHNRPPTSLSRDRFGEVLVVVNPGGRLIHKQ
jgi:hypothetical protein